STSHRGHPRQRLRPPTTRHRCHRTTATTGRPPTTTDKLGPTGRGTHPGTPGLRHHRTDHRGSRAQRNRRQLTGLIRGNTSSTNLGISGPPTSLIRLPTLVLGGTLIAAVSEPGKNLIDQPASLNARISHHHLTALPISGDHLTSGPAL